jgi:hypothetical protein
MPSVRERLAPNLRPNLNLNLNPNPLPNLNPALILTLSDSSMPRFRVIGLYLRKSLQSAVVMKSRQPFQGHLRFLGQPIIRGTPGERLK